MKKALPIVCSLGLLLAAWLRFLLFWGLLHRLSAKQGKTVAQGLHFDEPEAGYQALYELERAWNPVYAIKTTLWEWLPWVVVPLAFALWLWFRFRPERLRDRVALAAMPFFGGLIGYTGYVRAGFGALADAGLSNPGLIGAMVGEAAAVPITGLYCSLALGVALWWLTRRPRTVEDSDR